MIESSNSYNLYPNLQNFLSSILPKTLQKHIKSDLNLFIDKIFKLMKNCGLPF